VLAEDLVSVRGDPAAVLEAAVPILVGRPETLHDAVERHELDNRQLSHRRLPSR
jgi:hypothetical protein